MDAGRAIKTKTMKDQIIRLLEEKDYVPLSAENLQRHLRVAPEQEPEFHRTLRKLERDGEIVQIKGARYALASDADLIPGRIRMNRSGRGFLQPDDPNIKEISIAESATGTALHEDRVLVRRDVRRNRLKSGQRMPHVFQRSAWQMAISNIALWQ